MIREHFGLNFSRAADGLGSLLQDFQDLYHTVHADPSARAKVPILQDDGFTLIESALTVEYLDSKYSSAGTRLYPEDPALRFKVRSCRTPGPLVYTLPIVLLL